MCKVLWGLLMIQTMKMKNFKQKHITQTHLAVVSSSVEMVLERPFILWTGTLDGKLFKLKLNQWTVIMKRTQPNTITASESYTGNCMQQSTATRCLHLHENTSCILHVAHAKCGACKVWLGVEYIIEINRVVLSTKNWTTRTAYCNGQTKRSVCKV